MKFLQIINPVLCSLFLPSKETYQSFHQVRFVVPQSLHSVENIHHTLSLEHLTHHAAGTEDSTAATSISAEREEYNLMYRVASVKC